MGDLIVMPRPKPATARAVHAGHSAAILFFTGVRYYSMEEGSGSFLPQSNLADLTPPKRRKSPVQRRVVRRLRAERKLEIPA